MRRGYLSGCACMAGVLWAASAFATLVPAPASIIRETGLKPGLWKTTARITSVTVVPLSGGTVSPEVEAKLREKVGTAFSSEDCIGSDPAPDGDLILPGVRISAGCALSDVTTDKSRLGLKVSCGSPAGGFKADMTVQATHTDVAMASDIETLAVSAGAGHSAKIRMATTSSYAGDCPAPLRAP